MGLVLPRAFAHQRFHDAHKFLALAIRLGISRTAGDSLETHLLSKACHHMTCERYSMSGEDLLQCRDDTVNLLTGKLLYLPQIWSSNRRLPNILGS